MEIYLDGHVTKARRVKVAIINRSGSKGLVCSAAVCPNPISMNCRPIESGKTMKAKQSNRGSGANHMFKEIEAVQRIVIVLVNLPISGRSFLEGVTVSPSHRAHLCGVKLERTYPGLYHKPVLA